METSAPLVIDSSIAKEDLGRENEVEDTMLDLLKPFTDGLEERDDSSSTTLNAKRRTQIANSAKKNMTSQL